MPATESMVDKLIGDVCGKDVPSYSSTLSSLGYDDALCSSLAAQLDETVKALKPGTHINASEITPDLTVQNVIDITINQIGTY
jgi:hypothetical protein